MMKCSGEFYSMKISMTQQSGDFEKPIFTTITHKKVYLFSSPNSFRVELKHLTHQGSLINGPLF